MRYNFSKKKKTPPKSISNDQLLREGREFMELAMEIRIITLEALVEKGLLSQEQSEADRYYNKKVVWEYLGQERNTRAELTKFWLHSRQELILSQNTCKKALPAMFYPFWQRVGWWLWQRFVSFAKQATRSKRTRNVRLTVVKEDPPICTQKQAD